MSSGAIAFANNSPEKSMSILCESTKIKENNELKNSNLEVFDMVTTFSPYIKINSLGEVYLTKTASEIRV